MDPAIALRDVTSLAGCDEVVGVQHVVWGDSFDVVPASVLLVSAKRGGILVGAYDEEDALVGFVWSMPGWREGQPTHWSHMLGVLDASRGAGIGIALKRAQRDRALAAGIDLIEWTFDPLQAANAHLNIARLGCRSVTYLENAYGALDGSLHRGTPTDRLVAEWWVRSPLPEGPREPSGDATAMLSTRAGGRWLEVGSVEALADGPRLSIAVPPRFGEMQREAPGVALAWRHATRQAFTAAFGAGYAVEGFRLDRANGGGTYVLARRPTE